LKIKILRVNTRSLPLPADDLHDADRQANSFRQKSQNPDLALCGTAGQLRSSLNNPVNHVLLNPTVREVGDKPAETFLKLQSS